MQVEKKSDDRPGFLVRATQRGYYGMSIREPGDVFRITFARHFADHGDKKLNGLGWMEKVDGKSPRGAKQILAEERGAKPPPEDPAERERRMAKVDQMAEDAMAEDKASVEAEVI